MKTQTTEKKATSFIDESMKNQEERHKKDIENWIKSERRQPDYANEVNVHPLAYLTVGDLVGLHNYLRDEIDILSNCESPSERLKIAREQCILVEQEIDKRRTMLFGGEYNEMGKI